MLAKTRVIVGLIIAIFLLLGLALWYAMPQGAERFPLSWFVIAAAILGSVVNEAFRPREPRQPSYGWIIAYIIWKSGVSVTFAFVLYLLFIGELIGGDLFPHFVHQPVAGKQGPEELMIDFLTNVKPATYKDVAKVLVWSFVAGYSEKFVPNLITQLLNASAAEKRKKQA